MEKPFYRDPTPNLCQCDIVELPHLAVVEDFEVDNSGSVEIRAHGRVAPALIMNFDCELDKPWSERLVICPIVPLTNLVDHRRGAAKKNRIAHYFFMPRYRALWDDSIAVLNQQTTYDRKIVETRPRVATLTTEARRAFYAQFIGWLTRWELSEIECPNCEVTFDPKLKLPMRAPD